MERVKYCFPPLQRLFNRRPQQKTYNLQLRQIYDVWRGDKKLLLQITYTYVRCTLVELLISCELPTFSR